MVGERRAGAFWIVKSSVMRGLTPRAVDKLYSQTEFFIEGKVQLADDKATNPGSDPFTTRVFVGVRLGRWVFR